MIFIALLGWKDFCGLASRRYTKFPVNISSPTDSQLYFCCSFLDKEM